jgi:hypothetical protein
MEEQRVRIVAVVVAVALAGLRLREPLPDVGDEQLSRPNAPRREDTVPVDPGPPLREGRPLASTLHAAQPINEPR